jgi:hypothetical protein
MSNELLKKIDNAKVKFLDPIDQSRINSWESEAKRAFMVNSLKDHQGIKIILDNFVKDIAEIEDVLKSARSKDLSDNDRDKMIDRKELYKQFIKFFDDAEGKIERLEEEIDKEIISEKE